MDVSELSTPSLTDGITHLTVAAEGSCDPVMVGLVAIVASRPGSWLPCERRPSSCGGSLPGTVTTAAIPFAGRAGRPVPASVRDQTAAVWDALLQPALDHYEVLLRLPAATTWPWACGCTGTPAGTS